MSATFGRPSVRSTLCACGCGLPSPRAKQTRRHRGDVKGQPMRYREGHSPSRFTAATGQAAALGKPGAGDRVHPDRGYYAAHLWLRLHHPKTGVCSTCGGSERRTDWAWRHGGTGMPFSRDRRDYIELCRSCHVTVDQAEARAERAAAT